MLRLIRLFALLALIATPAQAADAKLTILVSIDGFRADYLDRNITPTLSALAAEGARGAMRPSFPSLTFPNHYAMVTGKRPDNNGIVGNVMQDSEIPGVTFTLQNREAVADARWWSQATPIWVSAERQGVRAATMFWPGSEAPFDGVRPTRWLPFNKSMPSEARVDQLLSWLDEKDAAIGLATLYFDKVDSQGHHYGPSSPQVNAAIAEVDAAIGRLTQGLKAKGLFETTNLIVVADHGMAPLPISQMAIIDEGLPPGKLRVLDGGITVGVVPAPGAEKEVAAALLKPRPHMTCWAKKDVPARFAFGKNRRVAPIVCLAETGWFIHTQETVARRKADPNERDGGAHGYDPADPTMHAVFIARGPSFKSGLRLPLFDNVDVYPLLAKVTGVAPEPGDGDLSVVAKALR